MRTTTVAIAVIIAGISVLLAWATMPAGPRGVTPPPPAPETFAIGFDIPSVRSLSVLGGGLEASVTGAPDWRLTLPAVDAEPVFWPANPDAVRVLLQELATQTIEAADHGDQTGQPPPLATVTLDLSGTRVEIAVLGEALAGRLPIRVTGADGLVRDGFVPAARFRPTDAGQLASLATPRPFDTEGVITRVTIDPAGTEAFTIERNAGFWSVPVEGSAVAPRLDQPTIRAMIDDLRRVRAASVIVPINDAVFTGEPFLRVATGSDVPRPRGEPARSATALLTIWGQSSVEGAYDAVATRGSGTPPAAESTGTLQISLDPAGFPVLPADINTLLDPRPLPFRTSDATSFRLGSAGAEVDLERTIDGWMSGGEPLGASQSDALNWLLVPLTQPAMRVRLLDPDRRFGGTPLVVESLGSPVPFELFLLPGDDGLAFEVSDGATVWEIDELGRRYDEALSELPRARPAP